VELAKGSITGAEKIRRLSRPKLNSINIVSGAGKKLSIKRGRSNG